MARRPFEEYRRPGATASLEDDWFTEVEAAPEDAEWFLSTGEQLQAGGELETARALVELWDEALIERGLWQLRLDALKRIGSWSQKPGQLQKQVVRTLEGLWAGKSKLVDVLEWVGLRKAVDQPAKLWDRVTRVGSLLEFEPDQVVLMSGHGVGRVVDVNLALESLKIDFEKRSGVTVGFRAAAKMLRVLPSDHPLRLKIEDPDRLARLRDEDPPALLRAVLETSDRPLTGGEVREVLAGVVPPAKWASWWTAARKHPQVVASSEGRPTYRWESSAADALDTVRQAFERAEPRQRLEVFRKNADRDDGLARELGERLAELAREVSGRDPGLSWEIFFTLERAGRLPKSAETLADELLGEEADVQALLAGISDRLLRERALAMIRERRADWPAIHLEQLRREEDPRVLDTLYQGLRETDPEAVVRQLEDLLSQPRRAPAAFTWIAERAAEDEALRQRAPLRLLQQIFAATADDAFSAHRVRLRALVESGGTVPRLLSHLDASQAAAALELVQRSPALETYQRDPLANALRLRFASLKDDSDEGPLYATAESIAAKQEELARLKSQEIPANRKAIEEARALGDLRENFEYKSARQRHEYLNARVATLHRDLGRSRPIEFARLDTSEVRIGCRVELVGPDGGPRRFSILGPWESRPEAGVVSYESELGRKLLGLRPGEAVQVGAIELRVASISTAEIDAVPQLDSPK